MLAIHFLSLSRRTDLRHKHSNIPKPKDKAV